MRLRAGVVAAAVMCLVTSLPPWSAGAQPRQEVDVIAPGYPIQVLDRAGQLITDCTAGFTVRDAAGIPLMLTSGHCDGGGLVGVFYRGTGQLEPLGSFVRNVFEDSAPGEPYVPELPDIGVVGLSATSVPVATSLLNRTPITAVARPRVGERLCKVGSYTGMSCGTVTKVSSSKVHFTAANRHGDSGGPVYRENGDGTVTAIAINNAMPNPEADCRIDHTGARDCVGTVIADLVQPWMNRWGLRI